MSKVSISPPPLPQKPPDLNRVLLVRKLDRRPAARRVLRLFLLDQPHPAPMPHDAREVVGVEPVVLLTQLLPARDDALVRDVSLRTRGTRSIRMPPSRQIYCEPSGQRHIDDVGCRAIRLTSQANEVRDAADDLRLSAVLTISLFNL